MNWINTFEIICYLITLLLLIDIFRKKKLQELYLFISGAIAGFALELLAVRITGIYHYSKAYFISVGMEPFQFPFFGGLMWGGIAVCGLRIAEKFEVSKLMKALITGWLVVSFDILLDVAAIRLDGGFWVWEGRPITLEINHHMFMSVIWVNFLGYLFETPSIVYLTLRFQKKSEKPALRNFIIAILIGFAGVIIVGIASWISLELDKLTDEWFSCIGFILVWCAIFWQILHYIFKQKEKLSFKGQKDWTLLIFWTSIYVYCFFALLQLGIIQDMPIYGVFAIFPIAGTLILCLLNMNSNSANKNI